MRKEPHPLILFAAGLVLAGIIVVWSGLTVIRLQRQGDWSLVVVFVLGAGLCLAGGLLGTVLWLRPIFKSKIHLAPRTRKKHLKPVPRVLGGTVSHPDFKEIIQLGRELSLPQVTWILILAILIPILVWLGIGLITISSADSSPASLWMGSQVRTWLPVLVKSWPIIGTWLQAICLLVLGAIFLRTLPANMPGNHKQGGATPHPNTSEGNMLPVQQPGLTPWTLCFGLLAGIGLWLVAIFMQRITLVIIPPGWLSWFSTITIDQTQLYGRVPGMVVNGLVLVMVIILVPLVEEVFFRGFLFHAWSRRYYGTWALIGSSALWAIYSLNPLVMPSLFLVGLGLGLITRRMVYSTGTIKNSHQIIFGMAPVWLARLVFTFLIFVV